jgi:hypothetical protein
MGGYLSTHFAYSFLSVHLEGRFYGDLTPLRRRSVFFLSRHFDGRSMYGVRVSVPESSVHLGTAQQGHFSNSISNVKTYCIPVTGVGLVEQY